jgi:hypothetical protein
MSDRLQVLADELSKIGDKLAAATDAFIQEGDKVQVKSRRKGWVDGTIVSVRPMRNGKVELHVVSPEGDFRWNAPDGMYRGKEEVLRLKDRGGQEQAAPLRDEWQQRVDDRAERKDDIAELGREALRKWDLKPGDKILFKYTNATREEVVVAINMETGKVGIAKDVPRSRQEEYERRRLLVEMYGMGRNPRPPRDTRWLHAQHILKVTERASDMPPSP